MAFSFSVHEGASALTRRERRLAALAYLGALCIIPYLSARQSNFVQRHAAQGMRLLLLGCAYALGTHAFERLILLASWQAGLCCSALFALGGWTFPLLAVFGVRAAILGQEFRPFR